ncbi:hypothetical protein ACWGJ2_08105 [Streptomyces sp. NPDC054796]
MGEPADPRESRADVAVLFVHGIGDQGQGDTLTSFSGPLLDCARRLVEGPGGEGLEMSEERSTGSAGEDTLRVTLRRDTDGGAGPGTGPDVEGTTATWLVSEAWWAKVFAAPSYGQLVRWLLLAGPQTLYRHALRYLIVPRPTRENVADVFLYSIYGLLYIQLPLFLWRRVLHPAVMVAVALIVQLVFLLLIPLAGVPLLRRLVLRIQYLLVATVGDSLAFVADPKAWGLMVDTVSQQLRQLDARASRIVVVAHSQGAAVAHAALKAEPVPSRKVTSFVTLGAGLDKLMVLRRGQDAGVLARLSSIGPLWAVLPAAGLALGLPWRGPVAIAVFVGSVLALVIAGLLLPLRYYRRLQRGIDRDLELPGQGDRFAWTDIHASADPVPGGRLLDPALRPWSLDPRRADVVSVEVQNHRSPFRDHTTYQHNVEQVLLPLIDRVSSATPLRLSLARVGNGRSVERGWARRWLRTRWRARVPLNTALLLFFSLATAPEGLIPFWPVVGAVLCVHVLAALAWRSWNRDESRRLLARGSTRSPLMVLFLLVAALPWLALAAGAHWFTPEPDMVAFHAVCFTLLWGIDMPNMLRRETLLPIMEDDALKGPTSLRRPSTGLWSRWTR